MKVAVSAAGRDPSAEVDPRFGRAPFFLLYDLDAGSWEPLENGTNLNAVQGAGIQAAQQLVGAGAGAVLTGHCGPKAYRTLAAADIAVYTGVEGTVESALQEYLKGALALAGEPDVQGHW